jgi:hypothetical protein
MSSCFYLRPVPGIKRFLATCESLGYKADFKDQNATKDFFPITNGKNWIWVNVSSKRVTCLTRFGRNDSDIIMEIAILMGLRCRFEDGDWLDLKGELGASIAYRVGMRLFRSKKKFDYKRLKSTIQKELQSRLGQLEQVKDAV